MMRSPIGGWDKRAEDHLGGQSSIGDPLPDEQELERKSQRRQDIDAVRQDADRPDRGEL